MGDNLSSQIQTFSFQGNDVRTLVIEDGETVWVASDVCRALGHTNTSVALSRLEDDEKGVSEVYTLGGPQMMATLTESGIYQLIMTSKTDRSKSFRRWVTHEVLPALRRAGHYDMGPPKDPIIAMLDACKETRQAQLELERRQAELARAVDRVEDLAEDAKTLALAATETVQGAANFVALVGFTRLKGLKLAEQELAREGKRAAKLSREKGYPIKSIPNQKYGSQNAYRVDLLEDHWWQDYRERHHLYGMYEC